MAEIIIRQIGKRDVLHTLDAMQSFTTKRSENTLDEIWFVEHPPVFTMGRRNKREHLINPGDIPVVQVDRGGHVTYHGPGQIVAYLLLDLKRKGIGIRHLVTLIENTIINLLGKYKITASARADAPGVYVSNMKIASLGLRISKGCCYHGLSLNVAMDLEPFTRIHPCGHPGLEVTQICDQGSPAQYAIVIQDLAGCLTQQLGYDTIHRIDKLNDIESISVQEKILTR